MYKGIPAIKIATIILGQIAKLMKALSESATGFRTDLFRTGRRTVLYCIVLNMSSTRTVRHAPGLMVNKHNKHGMEINFQ